MTDEIIAEEYPAVSVIVPVYNDRHRIEILLGALLDQDYPKDKVEILIVDNHSTDQTPEIIQRYPVHFLQEKEFQSSYAARNRGIQRASHDIIAFTDSDCRPDPRWLAEGINALRRQQADLAAGLILFTYDRKTAAEIYDSINHLQNRQDIQKHHSAPTANLFVLKKVIDKIGPFPVVESGGDLIWTLAAHRAGFRLEFAEAAVIYHPARGLKALLKKRIRTGRGTFPNWKKSMGTGMALVKTLRLLLPRRPSNIRKAIRRNGQPWMDNKFWRLWAVAWLCDGVSFIGIVMAGLGFDKSRRSGNRESEKE